MNNIIIKGRLTKDPELRQTNSGVAVCSASVAVDRRFSKEKETDFFSVTFWRQTAEFVSKYFSKGQEILVSGEMNSREYTDKDGNRRIVWELKADNAEFCGSKSSGSNAGSYAKKENTKKSAKAVPDVLMDELEVDDDTLPF